MNAVILAAGRGSRLGMPGNVPKCLVMLGGTTLLDHYLDELDGLGVPVTIVAGFEAHRVRKHVATRPMAPRIVENLRFAEGSVVSLQCGLGAVSSAQPLLLLDGDVAFTSGMLDWLATAPNSNALMVDVGTTFTDEQYMAGIEGGRVVALRRGPADGHEQQGEWVGFAKLSAEAAARLHVAVNKQVAAGDTGGGYEDALAALLPDIPFHVVPTSGSPWVEIDFEADLARARALFGSAVRTRERAAGSFSLSTLTGEANVFSFRGRINRTQFIVLTMAPYAFMLVTGVTRGGVHLGDGAVGALMALGQMAATWVSFATWARRNHDLGRSGWNALWQAIPLANMASWLHLARTPGVPSPNEHGEPPQ